MTYRPVRERPANGLSKQVKRGLLKSGYDEGFAHVAFYSGPFSVRLYSPS